MPGYLAKHCREWLAGKMDSEIIIIKRISRAPIYHTRWQHRFRSSFLVKKTAHCKIS